MDATTSRFRVMGYRSDEAGSNAWLTDGGDTTADPVRAQMFDRYGDADQMAVELSATKHLGMRWMPCPERESDLGGLQRQERRPWQRPTITDGPPSDW